MSKRYKATRSLHYVNDRGEDVWVNEDDWVEDAPEGTIRDLLTDGFVREESS